MGILAAVVRRQRTGQGCRVDASLMQSALDLQAESLVAWLNAPAKRPVNAFDHVAGWYFAAPYGVYATRDGHLALSLSPLAALAEAMGEPRLASFTSEDSWTRQDEISALIADVLATATTAEWVARLEPLEIWHAPVQGYAEIAADPQVGAHEVAGDGAGHGRDGRAADAGQPSRPLRRGDRRGAPAAAARSARRRRRCWRSWAMRRPRSRRWPRDDVIKLADRQ